jgi:hypothetical protein
MTLSDREQTVLREMELSLRADIALPTSARRTTGHGSRKYLAAAIGLLAAGVLALAVGLGLRSHLGTGLGVLGFILVVGSAWSGAHLLGLLKETLTVRKPSPARKSG